MKKMLNAFREMVDANKAVKDLHPIDWSERMKIYRMMITDQMKSESNVVFAAIILADRYSENDNSRMWIYATAVEMVPEG